MCKQGDQHRDGRCRRGEINTQTVDVDERFDTATVNVEERVDTRLVLDFSNRVILTVIDLVTLVRLFNKLVTLLSDSSVKLELELIEEQNAESHCA